MEINQKNIIILLLLVFTFVSCNLKVNNKRDFKELVNKYRNKKLITIIPDSVFYNKEYIAFDQTNLSNNSNLKIITYIDGRCHECIKSFKQWKNLIKIAQKNINFNILFYVKTNNVNEFKKYYYPKSLHNYPIIIVENNNILKKNNLTDFDDPKTFLLDKNNKIILIGNPLHGDKLMKLYKQEINKRLEKN
ncbi:MAG: hypothetical protein KGY70_20270 [Bacteroidales bacterium]|nr:hypothetical protein [Bacteroidales bacterium]